MTTTPPLYIVVPRYAEAKEARGHITKRVSYLSEQESNARRELIANTKHFDVIVILPSAMRLKVNLIVEPLRIVESIPDFFGKEDECERDVALAKLSADDLFVLYMIHRDIERWKRGALLELPSGPARRWPTALSNYPEEK